MRVLKLAIIVALAAVLIPTAASAHRHHGTVHYSYWVHYDGGEILPHPAGCPWRASCGCIASVKVFGHPVRSLYLAAAWGRFPAAMPGPGMAAYRAHHVFIIEQYLGGWRAIAYDGNSGGHLTRRHEVSLAGYRIVDPHRQRFSENLK